MNPKERRRETLALNGFMQDLHHRLLEKLDEGYIGWDCDHDGLEDGTASTFDLKSRLQEAVEDERYIDAAALAGMLWRRQCKDLGQLKQLKELV